MDDQNNQTPFSGLKESALDHYQKASMKIGHFDSSIPKAIRFYFDYLEQKEYEKQTLTFKINRL